MTDNRMDIKVSPEIYEKLKHYKGGETWNQYFKSLITYFEGYSGEGAVIKWLTHEDWNSLIERVEKLEDTIS